MSFTNPKPAGYAFGEKLPSGHVNSVWASIAKAVDPQGGGAYTLGSGNTLGLANNAGTTSWVLTDAGLTLNGTLIVASATEFTGPTAFDSGADIALNSTMVVGATGIIQHGDSSGDVYLANSVGLHNADSTDTYQANSNLVLNGNISGTTGHFVTGFIGQVDSGAKLKIAGTIEVEDGGLIEVKGTGSGGTLLCDAGSTTTINGALTMAGSTAAQLQRPLTLSGNGHINDNLNVIASPNADQSFTIADGTVFVVPGGLSADHNYTISGTGAAAGGGTRMRWYSGGIFKITLKQPDGTTTIAIVSLTPGSNEYYWVDICWNGSIWLVVGGQIKP